MSDTTNPFTGVSSDPVKTIDPIPAKSPIPFTKPITVEADKEEKPDLATEKAKVTKALADENAKLQQERERNKAAQLKADEAKVARPLKTVVVEGNVYQLKLKRIESILRRSNQSIAKMVQDIDTVIKE